MPNGCVFITAKGIGAGLDVFAQPLRVINTGPGWSRTMTAPHITDLYFGDEFAKLGMQFKRPRRMSVCASRTSSSPSLTPTFQGLLYTDAAYLLEASCMGM